MGHFPLLYLFRHGATVCQGLLVGSLDLPLSEKGRKQCRRWRAALRGRTFTAAWSSPLARARESAGIILSAHSGNTALVEPVPELREISLGEWEGASKDELRQRCAAEWAARGRDLAGYAPPGGESFAGLAARVLPAFDALLKHSAAHAHSLVVAHQAVNRVILARLLKLPLDRVLEIPQGHAALTILELRPDGVRLLRRSLAGRLRQ
ncbi:histidine phosphatase family protein [Desulfovibrio sp. OttesenSCG-928-A18]|nr:histidine phosphatase family protein [Desulfovibrio sp. OttesenSCG-928-A18]